MNGTGDTGEYRIADCENKKDNYYEAADEYHAQVSYFHEKLWERDELEKQLDPVFDTFMTAKQNLKEMEEQLERLKGGENPNQSRIDEINTRLDEIAAFGNIDERLDELTLIVAGEVSGDVDEAWQEIDLLTGLIAEKENLEAEKTELLELDIAELEQAFEEAKIDVDTKHVEYNKLLADYSQANAEMAQALDEAHFLKTIANNAADRFIDYGCEELLEPLEELDEI